MTRKQRLAKMPEFRFAARTHRTRHLIINVMLALGSVVAMPAAAATDQAELWVHIMSGYSLLNLCEETPGRCVAYVTGAVIRFQNAFTDTWSSRLRTAPATLATT
jgi:hypothetical protein